MGLGCLSMAANAGEWWLTRIAFMLLVFLLQQMLAGHISAASASALVSSCQLHVFPVEMPQCCYLLFCECFFEHVR